MAKKSAGALSNSKKKETNTTEQLSHPSSHPLNACDEPFAALGMCCSDSTDWYESTLIRQALEVEVVLTFKFHCDCFLKMDSAFQRYVFCHAIHSRHTLALVEESISLQLDNKSITLSPPGNRVQLQLHQTAYSIKQKRGRNRERKTKQHGKVREEKLSAPQRTTQNAKLTHKHASTSEKNTNKQEENHTSSWAQCCLCITKLTSLPWQRIQYSPPHTQTSCPWSFHNEAWTHLLNDNIAGTCFQTASVPLSSVAAWATSTVLSSTLSVLLICQWQRSLLSITAQTATHSSAKSHPLSALSLCVRLSPALK